MGDKTKKEIKEMDLEQRRLEIVSALNRDDLKVTQGLMASGTEPTPFISGERESDYFAWTDEDEVVGGFIIKTKILKRRLVGDGVLKEECSICGWNESRITDDKICLHLDYIDGNIKNKNYDNLRLTCSNCYYTNVGNFKSSKIFCQ